MEHVDPEAPLVETDPLVCPKCRGEMRVVSFITEESPVESQGESDEAARREVEALDAMDETDVDGGDGGGAGVDEATPDVPPSSGDGAAQADFIIGA